MSEADETCRVIKTDIVVIPVKRVKGISLTVDVNNEDPLEARNLTTTCDAPNVVRETRNTLVCRGNLINRCFESRTVNSLSFGEPRSREGSE